MPEIERIFDVVASASTSATSGATFNKLVKTELTAWDHTGRLSVEARERVVLSLLCCGTLTIERHPSGWGVAICAARSAVLERRRRLQGAWCEFDFLYSEFG